MYALNLDLIALYPCYGRQISGGLGDIFPIEFKRMQEFLLCRLRLISEGTLYRKRWISVFVPYRILGNKPSSNYSRNKVVSESCSRQVCNIFVSCVYISECDNEWKSRSASFVSNVRVIFVLHLKYCKVIFKGEKIQSLMLSATVFFCERSIAHISAFGTRWYFNILLLRFSCEERSIGQKTCLWHQMHFSF